MDSLLYTRTIQRTTIEKNTAEKIIEELKEITHTDEEILEEEVKRAVSRIKHNKSPGNDGITGETIKGGGDCGKRTAQNNQRSIEGGTYTPEEWKKQI